jgi:hypothetical protein
MLVDSDGPTIASPDDDPYLWLEGSRANAPSPSSRSRNTLTLERFWRRRIRR